MRLSNSAIVQQKGHPLRIILRQIRTKPRLLQSMPIMASKVVQPQRGGRQPGLLPARDLFSDRVEFLQGGRENRCEHELADRLDRVVWVFV
jgi:hypothetical protein